MNLPLLAWSTAPGSFTFFIVSVVALVFFVGFVFSERLVVPAVILTGWLIFADTLAGLNVGHKIGAHPYWSVVAVLVYFAIGTALSFFFWMRYVGQVGRQLQEERKTFNADRRGYNNWAEYVAYRLPSPTAAKEKIGAWITYWPLKLIAVAAEDLLHGFAQEIYRRCSQVYVNITERVRKRLVDQVSPERVPDEDDTP